MSEIHPVANPDEPAANQRQRSDLAGYPDTDSLVRGYRASGEEARRQRERAERAEALLMQAQQHLGQQPRPDIPQRPAQTLEDYGIPTPLLESFFEERFQKRFREELGPVVRTHEARNQMLTEYGDDYVKFESDVMRFLGSDAKLQQRYNDWWRHDPEGAMDWAFLKFGESRRKQAGSQANGGVMREARSEAQIPTGQASPRAGTPEGMGQEAQDAWSEFQRTGNPDARRMYVHKRLMSLPSVQAQIRAAQGY